MVTVMLDTGAYPLLVSADTLDIVDPTWRTRLCTDNVATTRFSLADGSDAVRPLGQLMCTFEVHGTEGWRKLRALAWVLPELTCPVILGSSLLDKLGAVINYNTHTLSFGCRTLEGVGSVPFQSKRAKRYRRECALNSITTVRVKPLAMVTLPVTIPEELECEITDEYREFGTVVSARSAVRKGVVALNGISDLKWRDPRTGRT